VCVRETVCVMCARVIVFVCACFCVCTCIYVLAHTYTGGRARDNDLLGFI